MSMPYVRIADYTSHRLNIRYCPPSFIFCSRFGTYIIESFLTSSESIQATYFSNLMWSPSLCPINIHISLHIKLTKEITEFITENRKSLMNLMYRYQNKSYKWIILLYTVPLCYTCCHYKPAFVVAEINKKINTCTVSLISRRL